MHEINLWQERYEVGDVSFDIESKLGLRSIMRKTILFVAIYAFCIVVTMCLSFSVSAKSDAISIDSFQITKSTPEFVEVELVGSNDDSKGKVLLGGFVKSSDGTVRSISFPPTLFPVGQKVHVVVRAMRPEGTEKSKTACLLIFAYQSQGEVFLRKKFDWPYDWPEIEGKSSDGMRIDKDVRANKPWQAFYYNVEDEDYSAIDTLFEEWNNPKEKDINGEWKLNGFNGASVAIFRKNDRNVILQFLQKWREINPKSAAAAIAEADYWVNSAWHIRGSEYDKTADPLAMKIFRERMKYAEKVLIASKEYSSKNPLWYEAYLNVAPYSGRDEKFITGLYAEAVSKHPYFLPLYVAMANYWAPKNGENANWNKVNALVNEAVSLTAEMDGKENYARLYSRISSQRRIDVDIFQDGHALWSRMKDSFEDMVAHYPSANNLNEFAMFACRAEDKDAFPKLMIKIRDHIITEKWRSNYSVDLCEHRFMQYL